MSGEMKSVDKARNLLKQLFRTENADLDFGIYRIMNYKRAEVERFIDKGLIEAADSEFKEFARTGAAELEKELEKRKNEINDFVPDTIGDDWAVLGNQNLPKVKEFLGILGDYQAASVSEEQIQDVFSHVYEFFSRYYEKGDFIPRTRFGDRDKYFVPYNGEEVLLHWATKDMYYVKTSEYFNKYSFKTGRFRVTYKLVDAQIEQGSMKGDKKFFILHDEEPCHIDEASSEVEIRFNYRTLTDEENERYGRRTPTKIQEDLIDKALAKIDVSLGEKSISAILRSRGDEKKSLMRKHLEAYVDKNTKDFFIHKDLRKFLHNEFECYLINEVWTLNQLENASENQMMLLKAKSKAIRNISIKIIDLLSQIEEFQKKLWEKKKFVLKTGYFITLDYIDEKYYDTILNNEKQLSEWKILYSFDIAKQVKKLGEKISSIGKSTDKKLCEVLKHNPTLAIDTKFFDLPFQHQIIGEIDDLDNTITGILIKSDNFQALKLLSKKYEKRIKATYIDPPYNTALSEIIYKNNYKHSSWLSLLASRLEVNKDLFTEDGILAVTIDNVELHRLRELIGQIFGEDNILGLITIKNNPSGRSTVKGMSVANEFAIICGVSEKSTVGMLPRTKEQLDQYPESDEKGQYQWRSFRRSGGQNDFRSARPRLFYPLIIKGDKIRIPKMNWNTGKKEWILNEELPENQKPVYPISNGVEYTWRLGVETLSKIIDDVRTRITRDGNRIIEIKFRLDERGILPKTVWDNKLYNSTSYGTSLLKNIFGEGQLFPFPKSVYAVEDTLRVCDLTSNDIVIDYFTGSGTTGHAVLNMNKKDGGKRKFILVEIGEYFDTILIPRLLKIIYVDEWKKGIPQDHDGKKKQIIKYQYLEQYEDTLNNIEFRQHDDAIQTRLDRLPDYFLTYMLNNETKNSPTLVSFDQFRTPFAYKIKIVTGGEEKEEPVDLVETFNYLLGLHIDGLRAYKDGERLYRVVYGKRGNEQVVVIWRDTPDLNLRQDKEFIENNILIDVEPDSVYINGDSHLKNSKPIEPELKRLMGA